MLTVLTKVNDNSIRSGQLGHDGGHHRVRELIPAGFP
jgi:hypothetical protein